MEYGLFFYSLLLEEKDLKTKSLLSSDENGVKMKLLVNINQAGFRNVDRFKCLSMAS